MKRGAGPLRKRPAPRFTQGQATLQEETKGIMTRNGRTWTAMLIIIALAAGGATYYR